MAFKIPKGQIAWVVHKDADGNIKQIITSDQHREKYFLYAVNGDSITKIETNDQPVFKNDIINAVKD